MTNGDIKAHADQWKWYHKIQLAPGVWTNSYMEKDNAPYWDMIREVRKGVDYKGKTVLDLGTMDGMWAFEAEDLGASKVVAADIWQGPYHYYPANEPLARFLFAMQARGSKVFPITNGDVHCLGGRVQDALRLMDIKGGFDIIQCFGLLYHVENPMLALREIRGCLAPKGKLILETAVWSNQTNEPVMRFNSDSGIYHDWSTYWAPNLKCMTDMLEFVGFVPMVPSMRIKHQPNNHNMRRACIICET